MGAAKAGGAELFFIRLMKAFAQRADEIEILPVVRKGSWAAERLAEAGIKYATAGFGGMFDMSTAAVCRRLAAEFQPQVCMSWMNRATRFMPQPKAGSWATVARLGGYYPLKNYRAKVTHLVANTLDIVAYCRNNGWPVSDVDYIPNFVPPLPEGWGRERSRLRAELRGRLGIPAGATVLLMAARLHEVKGYDVALHALAALPQDVYLVAVGEGPEREALAKLAGELGVAGRVCWAGWADNLSDYAAAADVWLVPSRHEPLGNSVLDAWNHGIPVVASRSAGPVSLIEDGVSGVLVPVGDAEALAAAVRAVAGAPETAAALAAGGAARLVKDFSEEVVVARYLAYYRGLIEGGAR